MKKDYQEERIWKILNSYEEIDRSNVDLEQIFNKVIKARSISFGKKLRSIRRSKEYSQLSMANYLNIRRATYISWESGSHVPRLPTLIALAELLETDICDLITGLEANPLKNGSKWNIKKASDSLPLLSPKSLERSSFLLFLNEFSVEYKKLPFKYFQFTNKYDCVFIQNDSSMDGVVRSIKKGASVLCSFKLIKEIYSKSNNDILQALSGKIVLLTILGRNPMLREVYFDGEKLHLIAWNEKIESMVLPTGELPDKDKSIHADNVEFFAVAEKVIFDL